MSPEQDTVPAIRPPDDTSGGRPGGARPGVGSPDAASPHDASPDDASPDDASLVRAVEGVPGILEAVVHRDADSGRTRLRLRMQAGGDRERAAWSVAAVLRERFGIALDPAAIRPVADEEPVAPPPPPPDPGTGHRRVTVTGLDLRRDGDRVAVTVGLTGPHGRVEGRVRAPGTQRGTARAVAEATVQAVARLLVAPVAVVVDEVLLDQRAEPPRATVALTLVAGRGEEPLLGIAVVRDDADRAVVRATLDALNRRVTPLLRDGGGSQG